MWPADGLGDQRSLCCLPASVSACVAVQPELRVRPPTAGGAVPERERGAGARRVLRGANEAGRRGELQSPAM